MKPAELSAPAASNRYPFVDRFPERMFLYIFCTIIILVAFGGEALFGFGGGLVAVPLLSLVIAVGDAVVLVSVFEFLIGFLIIKNYRSVAWHLMPPLLIGMLGGVFVGVYALSFLNVWGFLQSSFLPS